MEWVLHHEQYRLTLVIQCAAHLRKKLITMNWPNLLNCLDASRRAVWRECGLIKVSKLAVRITKC
jgi:hypothetical protein